MVRWALGRLVGHDRVDAYLDDLRPYAARHWPDAPRAYLRPPAPTVEQLEALVGDVRSEG